jgi:hypothetical protein
MNAWERPLRLPMRPAETALSARPPQTEPHRWREGKVRPLPVTGITGLRRVTVSMPGSLRCAVFGASPAQRLLAQPYRKGMVSVQAQMDTCPRIRRSQFRRGNTSLVTIAYERKRELLPAIFQGVPHGSQ